LRVLKRESPRKLEKSEKTTPKHAQRPRTNTVGLKTRLTALARGEKFLKQKKQP